MAESKIRALPVIVALAFSASALAVPDDDNEMLSLSLAELSRIKIVTATMHDETPQSVPSSMSVYSRDEIRNLGITQLEDLINLVPGYESNRDDIAGFNRGISSRGRRGGTTGRDVLVLIDGRRINGDASGGAGLFDPMISLDNVERVEFIRGPGSSIYGSNAILGVINVITAAEKKIDVRVGSHRLRESALQWSGGDENKRLELFAKYGKDDGDALTIYNPDPFVQAYESTRDPLERSEMQVKAKFGELSVASRWARRESEQFYAGGGVADDINKASTDSSMTTLGWLHGLNDALFLQANATFSDRRYRSESMANSVPQVFIKGRIYERESSADIVLRSAGARQRWLLGSEFRQPDVYEYTTTLQSPNPDPLFNTDMVLLEDGDRTIRGYFAQHQYDFGDGFSTILGLRYDDYSDIGGHTSPRGGLIKQLGRRDTVKLLYGEAFRSPTQIDTRSATSSGFVPNPDLKPEVAKTTEVVWLHTFNRAQLSTSLFDVQVDDAIHDVATGTTSQRSKVNASETIAGVEMELSWRLAQHWSGRAAFTHFFDEFGDVSANAATLFSTSIVYTRARWHASVRAVYQGEREDAIDADSNAATDEHLAIPSRSLVAVHAAYDVSPSVQFYGDIGNLFDRNYVSVAERYSVTQGVPERGRVAVVGVNVSF